ncbi:MAG: DUF3656 domain-containing protein [Aureliella sp.]
MNASEVELLAPAGNWDCARAAVENGADAIYFGLDAGFNARARAANFHLDELDELVEMLHRQAVRGYVTLNTLAFTDELVELEGHVRRLADAGIDAVLVQDLGVARLIKQICPTLSIHASTQMTLTHADAIEQVRELGIDRVVLARELSIKEIRKIASATDMPIEVFVHGALCVAYSGQCLTSESLGGRSANRGQCAQACRLPYELHCDGERVDLGDVKYLLSPQDLAAHDLIPDLIAAGVCSLKIEGRLKTPEYVANVCNHYRQAIDAALDGSPKKLSMAEQHDLEMSFSRGFSPGWLEGCDHKRLVPGESSSKKGVLVGEVTGVGRDAITVRASVSVSPGDGIVLEGNRFESKEIGGRVYSVDSLGSRDSTVKRKQSGDSQRVANDDRSNAGKRSTHGQVLRIGLEHGLLEKGLERAGLDSTDGLVGLRVWKTDDPQLTKRLRRSFSSNDPVKRVNVDVHVNIEVGKTMELTATTKDLASPVRVHSDFVPELARKHAIDIETLEKQFSRLGGTHYRLGELSADIDGEPMVPLSVLGAMRKDLVEALTTSRVTKSHPCAETAVANRMLGHSSNPGPTKSDTSDKSPTLRVLCRTLPQLRLVLGQGVKDVIAEFHDIREYREAVQESHAVGAHIELATLRILKPGEEGLFKALHKHGADGWLVRNLSAVRYCIMHGIAMAVDFSLNVTNPLSVQQLSTWGVNRLTPSYDLNREQLIELVSASSPEILEVVIHQHMPMFHMEHCVFCSVLSPGKNKTDCGRPCDRHQVEMRDRVGADHVLQADIGCRNTLYNGVAQSGSEAVKPLMELGVRHFRVELLAEESEVQVAGTLGLYRKLIAGEISGSEVWQKLNASNRVGVTRGTLEQPRNPLAIL